MTATEEHLVIRDFPSFDLARVAIETEVGDPVLPARVWAAANFNAQRAGFRLREVAHHIVDSFPEIHRLRERKIAGVSAGAGSDVLEFSGVGLAQTDRIERGMQTRKSGQRNKRKLKILIDCYADQSIAGGLGNFGETAHLVGREIALVDANARHGVAGLFLLLNIGLEPAVVMRI